MLDTRSTDVTKGAFASALVQYTVSSVGMMLGNKLAVNALPLPCLLVIIQIFGTLVLLIPCRAKVQAMTTMTARDWLPIAILFTLMMYTSMKSFVYVNVSTVLIFRNVGALVTTVVEYFVRAIPVTTEIILSEFVIVAGAFVYGWSSAAFNWWGFVWIIANVSVQVAYGVLLKRQMDLHPAIKEMSKFTMSLHNNVLALPFIVLMMIGHGELAHLDAALNELTFDGVLWIGITCILGFMISTSGFALQQLVSATVFLVINNLTKFLNIALGMIFLQDRFAGIWDWSGCLAAFLGGFWFSYASMRANQQQPPPVPAGAGGRRNTAFAAGPTSPSGISHANPNSGGAGGGISARNVA